MRTAADPFSPNAELDDAWRDLVVSSAPPPVPPPVEQSQRISVPVDVMTNRHGCVADVQFGSAPALEPERPSFDDSDRRMWRVAGALMGLATVVLIVLAVLSFRGEPQSQTQASLPSPQPVAVAVTAPTVAQSQEAVGSARPFIAQRGLRHVKHARKHKKLAER